MQQAIYYKYAGYLAIIIAIVKIAKPAYDILLATIDKFSSGLDYPIYAIQNFGLSGIISVLFFATGIYLIRKSKGMQDNIKQINPNISFPSSSSTIDKNNDTQNNNPNQPQ